MTSDNPYAPPKSNVTMPVAPSVIGPKPKQVVIAVWLQWISILLQVPIAIHDYQRTSDGSAGVLFVYVVTFSFLVALTLLIDKRRNWARIALTVLMMFSVASWLVYAQAARSYPTTQLVLNTLLVVVGIQIIYLLFTRPASLWFRPGALN